MEGLLTTLDNNFKPQYIETIKSLQFHKSVRQPNENVEEWIGKLRLAAVECTDKEKGRQWKEHFINRLNDNNMLVEIIKELTQTEGCKDVASYQVLAWAKTMGAKKPSPQL